MRELFKGFLPALVTPFDNGGKPDEASFARVVDRVAGVEGVSGVVVNGHAGEVTSLRREERRRVTELATELCAHRLPVVSGIAVETPDEGVEHALDAQEAGADALLVLPPHGWLIGMEPAAPLAFFRELDAVVDIPLIVFQYPASWGGRYDERTLLALTQLSRVEAVKDASWEISAYEEDYRLLKRERPGIAVLSANDEHVLTSFVIGADGALLGFGSIAADIIVAILHATRAGDLHAARRADECLYPLTRAFYKTSPRVRMHSRIKYGLYRLGVIASPHVRQPLLPLDDDERRRADDALRQAGLLDSA